MLKNFIHKIHVWLSDLFGKELSTDTVKSSDSWSEARDRRNALLRNSGYNMPSANSGEIYSNYNPADLYAQYNATGQNFLTSLFNKWGESGITGQQAALNEMQLDNQRRNYAFQVQGMQEAGLNPALMFESGSMSGPNAPSATQGMSLNMSDVLQAMLLNKQSDLLEAQTANVNADTDKKKAETENMQLINKYYPQVTDTQIRKVLSDMGVNDERINEIRSQVDLNELDKQLKAIDIRIKNAEADESSAYYKATRELQEAKTEEARSSAREHVADAVMKEIEGIYEANTNTKMSSSSLLAIASALGTIFGNSDDFHRFFKKYIYDKDDKYGWLGQMAIDKYWDFYAKRHHIQGAAIGGGGR